MYQKSGLLWYILELYKINIFYLKLAVLRSRLKFLIFISLIKEFVIKPLNILAHNMNLFHTNVHSHSFISYGKFRGKVRTNLICIMYILYSSTLLSSSSLPYLQILFFLIWIGKGEKVVSRHNKGENGCFRYVTTKRRVAYVTVSQTFKTLVLGWSKF